MTIKQFSQTDPLWKNALLGFDKTSTIGVYGCLLTSLSMCATFYGAADLTPATLNDKMKASGGFQAGTAFIIGSAIGNVVSGMSVDYRKGAALTEIDAALAQGLPVILEVDWSPQAGVQTHYMTAYAKAGNDYMVYDPFPYPTSLGHSKLTQSKYASIAGSTDPAKIITGCFLTRGPAQILPPTPPKLDKGVYASYTVFAAADSLALRSQPLVADATLLKRYPLNTVLKVLESDASANPKLGQQNQWLAVMAPDGIQGYTAAWLVSKTQTTNVTPATGAVPAVLPVPSNAIVVKTTVDSLKLRSKPDNTDATILKYYPLGTELKCLESASDVQRKVGVNYEWLQVADLQGAQGVVAAWYVSIVTQGSFGPQPQTQAAAPTFMAAMPSLTLRTTEDGVAMRSQPVIAPQTLIQRLPRGTELAPMGNKTSAANKIGQSGKWLKVKDVKGNKGHVAAWLVQPGPQSPAPENSPADC